MKTSRYSTSRQKACQECVHAKTKCDRKAPACRRCARRSLSCIYPRPTTPATPDPGAHTTLDSDMGSQTLASSLASIDGLMSRGDSAGSDLGPRLAPSSPLGEAVSASPPPPATGSVPNTHGCSLDQLSAAATAVFVGSPASEPPLGRSGDGCASGLAGFSDQELVCPIHADGISIRWMNSYIPTPGQTVKAYPPSTITFVHRMLHSYVSVAVRGRGVPPFIHRAQLGPRALAPPLATCLSLVRICDSPLPGTGDVAAGILMREMNTLYHTQSAGQEGLASLAVFQAYLLYLMVLFFRLEHEAGPFLREAVIALQEIACASARRGLVCVAEQARARPSWGAWAVAEAKRRTLYTMYLFDSVLSARDGLPTYLGIELRGLPAPASKSLWEAVGTHEAREKDGRGTTAWPETAWEAAYNAHLAEWPDEDGGLRIDELWPIPAGLDEAGIARRRRRVDRWLEGIDEYGTMMYAVTSCTHGG